MKYTICTSALAFTKELNMQERKLFFLHICEPTVSCVKHSTAVLASGEQMKSISLLLCYQ